MSLDNTAIRFEKVSFSYGEEPVLIDVEVSVATGEYITIVGPNGGGKTTFLKLILGLVKPDRGKLAIFGQPPEKARGWIGYVPQFTRFDPLFPATVLDVVLMGRLRSGSLGPYRKEDRQEALWALREVDMEELRDRPLSSLSGGQRQRVLIARALSPSARLLLLDEPTSSVDRLAQQKLYELLQSLNRYLTILLVSHDLGVVSAQARSVLCVNRTVLKHSTCELTGDLIRELYGGNIAMVRHGDIHA